MPAHRKPEGTRQDNSAARELATVVDINGGKPAYLAPHKVIPSWLKQTKEQWDDFWQADVAKVLANHHIPALYRLFELRDAQARALRIYKKQPMVFGWMPALAIYFHDPDGHALEFIAMLPDEPHPEVQVVSWDEWQRVRGNSGAPSRHDANGR